MALRDQEWTVNFCSSNDHRFFFVFSDRDFIISSTVHKGCIGKIVRKITPSLFKSTLFLMDSGYVCVCVCCRRSISFKFCIINRNDGGKTNGRYDGNNYFLNSRLYTDFFYL